MMRIEVKIKSQVNSENNIHNFKNKLLDQLSSNTKLIFEKNTPQLTTAARNNYKIHKSETQHEITNDKYYLPFVNDGTGIYGPKHTPIKPKKANVLHFYWHGKEFFVKSVKGQKPKHFVERSMVEVLRSVDSAVTIAKRGTLE